MEEIAKDEMRHAETLSELIVDLGGIRQCSIRNWTSAREARKGI